MTEVFDDSDFVGAGVVLLHGCPKSCMPNPVEGLLEVCEVMARSCWYWRYFSQRIRRLKICSVVLLPALKLACSSAIIFSACGFSLFCMIFSKTAWVADKAGRSVILVLLRVAFLGKCDDQGLGPWGWPLSCLSDLVAHCRESGDYILSTCLDKFCWDVVNSS